MERAADIIKNMFAQPGDPGSEKYLPLFKNWKSIVGKDLENRVRLRDIRKHALLTEVAHPGWMQAVLLRKKTILKRINTLYPGLEITDIKMSIVKKPAARVILPKNNDKVETEDADNAPSGKEIEEMLSGMDENELKKALKKLYSSRGRQGSEPA